MRYLNMNQDKLCTNIYQRQAYVFRDAQKYKFVL